MNWTHRTLIIAAAGTGGHIFPALAIAHKVLKQNGRIHWIGSESGMEHHLLKAEPFPLSSIQFTGFLGKHWLKWLKLPWQLTRAFLQSLNVLWPLRKHSTLLVMGGYISLPVSLASFFLRIPLIVHEQNAKVGLANRICAYLAHTLCESFPDTFTQRNKTLTTGNPIRDDIQPLPFDDSYEYFDQNRPMRILVVGGSLGAQVFNDTLPEAVAALPNLHLQVKLQCGSQRSKAVQTVIEALDQAKRVYACEFIHDMTTAYQWADLLITRAGASTISEVAQMNKPVILVPFPQATDDHQTANANWLTAQGGGWLLPQSECTATRLANQIDSLYNKPISLKKVSIHLSTLSNNASDAVIEACHTLLN